MRTEIIINNNANSSVNYISWTPIPGQIRLVDAGGVANPVKVKLKNQNQNRGGQLLFFAAIPSSGQDELQLSLPVNGSPVNFFVAGKFGKPSIADRDAVIEVKEVSSGSVLSTLSLMVRIRKNANTLTTAERDRFLSALARLNDAGRGKFSDFRNIHTDAGVQEAHGNAGFLPWHRAYLLDLERELQQIDPGVALPYWKFDEPAPKLFTRDFLGTTNSQGTVQFSASNPLLSWTTDGTVGINRRPLFNTLTAKASDNAGTEVISEMATIQLGGGSNRFTLFTTLEGQPHGQAHVSFNGSISQIGTAAKDPLFFLLHANVDRLWAKWQWIKRRFDLTSTSTYSPLGKAGDPGSTRIGHNLKDTMWPWNQITTRPRPPTAPGGNLASSPVTAAPGLTPTVGSMIDYQGVLQQASRLGFGYDDVPFEFL